jgi:hypothetical protein
VLYVVCYDCTRDLVATFARTLPFVAGGIALVAALLALELEVEQLVLLLRETCAPALQRCYLIGQVPSLHTGCVCERLGLGEHALGV